MHDFFVNANHIGWRVPNRVFVGLSLIVILLTLTMFIIAYPLLPSAVPSHFGMSGMVDATTAKTWWSVFFPVIFQVVIVALMSWLSRHPEWSNLPTGPALRLMPEPAQGIIRRLLAHMLVMMGLLVSLLFAYLGLGIIRVGLGETNHLNTWAMFALVGLLFLIIGVYTSWMVKITSHYSKQSIT